MSRSLQQKEGNELGTIKSKLYQCSVHANTLIPVQIMDKPTKKVLVKDSVPGR